MMKMYGASIRFQPFRCPIFRAGLIWLPSERRLESFASEHDDVFALARDAQTGLDTLTQFTDSKNPHYFNDRVTWSVIESSSEGQLMNITIEAVYEAGVFKPLSSVDYLKEHDRVRLVVEPANLIDAQRQNRIQIDPEVARGIGDSLEYDLFEG